MANEDKAKKVADRIAERLRADESYGNYEGGWDDLQAKLDRMYQEMQTRGRIAPAAAAAQAPHVGHAGHSTSAVSHSSQERFNINEAVVEELVEFFEKEKACSFEPNGKPCDHCAMCSSRGF